MKGLDCKLIILEATFSSEFYKFIKEKRTEGLRLSKRLLKKWNKADRRGATLSQASIPVDALGSPGPAACSVLP